MALTLITPPEIEPISVIEAKNHLRVDFNDDDDYIAALISASRDYAESFTNRALLTQTWQLTFDHFPGRGLYESGLSGSGGGSHYSGAYSHPMWFELPRSPLLTVKSLKYIDSGGVLQTDDPTLYQVDALSEPARIAPAVNQIWPWTQISSLQPVLNAVQIVFDCGHGAGSVDGAGKTTLPAGFRIGIRQAMQLIIGHWYENRMEVLTGVRAAAVTVPLGASMLLWMNRVAV